MKFKELPKRWKVVIVILTALTLFFVSVCVLFSLFWSEYQKNCANMRVPLKKPDSELIGERIEILRGHKEPVAVNLYMPNDVDGGKLPAIINIHGGGFVGGDADVLDTQSDRISKEWNAVVISVNYTKADVKPTSYGAEEIKDAVLYFTENAKRYSIDTTKIYIMGYSAGAYYASESTRILQDSGFKVAGLVMCYPWTTGLSTNVLSSEWCPTLFILAGQDPISQRAKPYAESMKNAGIEVKITEYENAVHSFIESNNPEGVTGSSEDMGNVINPEQEKFAREAESVIKEWISSQ